MICKKCGTFIEDEDVMVLKRGTYENKPLCEKCFVEEKSNLLGE